MIFLINFFFINYFMTISGFNYQMMYFSTDLSHFFTPNHWTKQSSALPLVVGRGLYRGWCTLWCPRDAGPGDGCRGFPSVHCPPFPEGTSQGWRRWRWTIRGWILPPQSLCTCHLHQNNFPEANEKWTNEKEQYKIQSPLNILCVWWWFHDLPHSHYQTELVITINAVKFFIKNWICTLMEISARSKGP